MGVLQKSRMRAGRLNGDDMQGLANSPLSLPEGEIENSPGWSPPGRTEPWDASPTAPTSPRGADRESPPDLARVELDTMFLEKCNELRLEVSFLMMLFLARYVRQCGRRLRQANGESAVALLPFETRHRAGSCIQREDALLISRIALAIGRDDERDRRM